VRKNYFDGPVARGYDATSTPMFEPAVVGPTVEFLAGLAGAGPALEFAVGTGRVAVPLSKRGVAVAGIDLSTDMIEQLRAKPGAEAIPTTIGSFTDTRVEGTFSLVYLVYNTIMNVTTQDEQVETFCNAAAHLEPGGAFVIEVVVPELRRLPPGQNTRVFTNDPDHLGVDEFDVVTQTGFSHHYFRRDNQYTRWSGPWRYVWPGELDLMARLAGMSLRERWADWNREPFTSESDKHISVWTKDA
jgi:SAM-dependent methyltransferase